MKKGWQTKTLSDVCGISSVLVDPRESKYEDMVHVGGANIESTTGSLIDLKTAKEEGLKSGKFVFDDTMVLYSKIRPYLMKVARPEFRGLCSADIYPLSPNPSILDRGYLFHQLLSPSFTEFAISGSARAGMPKVNRDHLFTYLLPLPPLAEQQRIVGLLDEAFEGIATAKANAEKNLQNARALFESHLQSVFSQRGKGWVETTLGAATEGVFTGPFGSLLHKRDYVENGIPLVNPAHITETGIEPDLRKTVSKSTAKRLGSYIMHAGDIVIGRRGEMGRCALVTEAEDGWLCGTGSFFLKASKRCNPGYLVRFLRSEECKKRLEKMSGGTVMPNLSNTALSDFSLALPPLEDQKLIVAMIDALSEETQRLATLYTRKLAALEALKKSLLHQAFRGDL